MSWRDLAFILGSPLRRKILECLARSRYPLTPKEIARQMGIARSNVSTKLCQLRRRNLVTCLNPEDKKPRFYVLTRKGRNVLREVRKLDKKDNRVD